MVDEWSTDRSTHLDHLDHQNKSVLSEDEGIADFVGLCPCICFPCFFWYAMVCQAGLVEETCTFIFNVFIVIHGLWKTQLRATLHATR